MLVVMAAIGCGDDVYKSSDRNAGAGSLGGLAKKAGPAGEAEPAAPAEAKPADRKIIYSAKIDVIVDDFDAAQARLIQFAKEQDAYVARSELSGTPGTPRRGSWTIRVPAAHFDTFREAVTKLGELRRSSTDSNDITDAYYDLQAHIKNDQTREEGLRKLYLDKAAGSKLEDLLAVDRELSAVRGKIDAQKGQMQRWDKEVALSTATVTLEDRRGYISPVIPNFGGHIGRVFQDSVEALVAFGKFLVLAVVLLTPWLAVLAIMGVPTWFLLRRRRRQRA
jgi:hypothetical protein